jgi:HAMP domain-containing protein
VYVLALALGFYVVMDSIYAYQTLNETYVTGTLFDVGWPVAYMLIGLGAFAAQLAPTRETTTPDELGDTLRTEYSPIEQRVWPSLLPYALVPAVGVLAIYAWRASAGSGSLAAGVYVGGALLIGLVLLRQILTIVENARLYNRLQRMYVQMEQYLRNVDRVTSAAAAVEAGEFDPKTIEQVAAREDELGQLARVFQQMAREVQAREQHLEQEVQQLRIEIDETRTARQVAEITETDYFRDLQRKANRLRSRADVDQ